MAFWLIWWFVRNYLPFFLLPVPLLSFLFFFWFLNFSFLTFFLLFKFFSKTDSVKALLGRHTKILIKYMVKLETKGDKTDNRVLVSILIRRKYKIIFFRSFFWLANLNKRNTRAYKNVHIVHGTMKTNEISDKKRVSEKKNLYIQRHNKQWHYSIESI